MDFSQAERIVRVATRLLMTGVLFAACSPGWNSRDAYDCKDDPPVSTQRPDTVVRRKFDRLGPDAREYGKTLRELITQNWEAQSRHELEHRNPNGYCLGRLGRSFPTEMRFIIDRSGTIHEVWLYRSSGVAFLDNFALRSLRTLHLPPPPAAFFGDDDIVEMPYTLIVHL